MDEGPGGADPEVITTTDGGDSGLWRPRCDLVGAGSPCRLGTRTGVDVG